MTVRPATEKDIPILLDMGKRFFDASGYGDRMEFHFGSCKRFFQLLIQSHVLLVYGEKPVGMVGAMVHPAFFNSKELYACELFWWVNPDARGVGGELLDALEKAVKDKGASHLSMLSLERLDPEKVGEMYKHRGYSPVEHSYMKEL